MKQKCSRSSMTTSWYFLIYTLQPQNTDHPIHVAVTWNAQPIQTLLQTNPLIAMALPKSSRQCTKPHHKKTSEEWSGNCDLASINSPDPNPIKHPWDVLSKSLIHGCPGSQSTGTKGSGTSILVPDTSGHPPRPWVYPRVKPSQIHKGASVDHIWFKHFIYRLELNNTIFQDCFL